jgi:hypothetical protein
MKALGLAVWGAILPLGGAALLAKPVKKASGSAVQPLTAGEAKRAKRGTESTANANVKATAGQFPTKLAVRVVVEVPEGTPSFYANFIEVSQTKWDFSLIFATLPSKPTMAKVAEMQATGVLSCPAEVTINFPTTIMAGLIRALNMQKEAYEKENGVELKDPGDEPNPPKK